MICMLLGYVHYVMICMCVMYLCRLCVSVMCVGYVCMICKRVMIFMSAGAVCVI